MGRWDNDPGRRPSSAPGQNREGTQDSGSAATWAGGDTGAGNPRRPAWLARSQRENRPQKDSPSYCRVSNSIVRVRGRNDGQFLRYTRRAPSSTSSRRSRDSRETTEPTYSPREDWPWCLRVQNPPRDTLRSWVCHCRVGGNQGDAPRWRETRRTPATRPWERRADSPRGR